MLERLHAAAARRERIRQQGTDALRLCDGAADGLPDLEIDDFAGRWLVRTRMHREFPAPLLEANPAGSIYWKPLGEKAPARRVAGPAQGEPFLVRENHLRYWIDFTGGYEQGLFLDQRENRSRLRQMAGGKTALNTFAYTCAFGVALAASGARVTNLDLSRSSLDWGRRNFEANALDLAAHDFIYGDCFDWMKRLQRQERRFDMVILDPPTFSRDRRGRVFQIERDLPALVTLALSLLERDGALFVSTNLRKLRTAHFQRIVKGALPGSTGWRWEDGRLPPDFTGEQYLKSALITLGGGGQRKRGPSRGASRGRDGFFPVPARYLGYRFQLSKFLQA